MYDSECLLLDSNDHPSSCTQPSNSSISMSIDSSSEHYTRESIMLALKYKPKEYTTVKKTSKALCWSKFGLPAKIIGPGKFEIIKNFASCTSCFQTYSYSSSTTAMSNHKCKCLVSSSENQSKIELIPLVKSNTSTTYSDTTTSDSTNSVNHKTLQKHKRLMTSVISDWVCSNTRPINIVEDIGLKELVEQCIKTSFVCGPVSASSILPCRKTISKEIKETANNCRNKIKDILIKAARERSLTLSPDLWSDGYKKTSYLGCTAHWVDSLWKLNSLELFCLPYRQSNKTGASILKVLEEGLSLFDLVPFMSDIIWVCDGGSNLLKALEKFTVVRCVAHRLNNCLQTIFFQTNASKVKKHILFPDHFHDESEDEDDQDSKNENEQNDDGFDDDGVNDQQKACAKYNFITSNKKSNAVSFIAQLPTDVKRILVTIVQCKELVKYVKKINLNQDLEDRNALVLLQCTIVRWLSLLNCLESVNKSLITLGEIFEEKNLNKGKLDKINVCLLNKLIDFLKPWEYVMKRVQSSKIPSIHIVTPSICIINSSLETKSDDSKQDKG
ncbi:unnamed protein product [Rotaria socialis]|nr:unnamed protein product [Rotaria socialis]